MTYDVSVTSWDGEKTFHVYGSKEGDEGVYLLQEPVGLLDADIKPVWQSTTNSVGARPISVDYPPRDLTLPFGVVDDALGASWRATEDVFRQSFSELHDSTISVTTEYGTRTLKCRLLDKPNVDNKEDPATRGIVKCIYTLRAGNPMWQGEKQELTWTFTGKNFYDTITVSNPGDRPLWPQWVLQGATSVVLPDIDIEHNNNHYVTMPFQLPGQNVLVDTRPGVEEAVCAGHPMWLATVPDHFLYPIPPHTESYELPIIMNPFPFADDIMASLGIPTRIDHRLIVETAKALSGIMDGVSDTELAQLTENTLAGYIMQALETAKTFVDNVVVEAVAAITAATVGQLLKATYNVIPSMQNQQVGLVLPVEYSRPWGMEA